MAATPTTRASTASTVDVRRFDLLRDGPAPSAPTVLANLLRPLLLARRAPTASPAPAPRALIASGLLAHEADEVAAAFAAHGLRERARRDRAASGPRCCSSPPAEAPSAAPARPVGSRDHGLACRDRRRRLRGLLRRPRRSSASLPPQSARITLVNDVNFMLYTPLLPGAAAGTLEPRHVVVPLREELRRTDLRLGTRRRRRPGRNAGSRSAVARGPRRGARLRPAHRRARLGLADAAGARPRRARASASRRCPTPIELRNHVLRTLEAAETLEDPAERQAWLTYVFVGAGYAGLEGLAELQDFAADVIELLPALPHAGDALDPRRGAATA